MENFFFCAVSAAFVRVIKIVKKIETDADFVSKFQDLIILRIAETYVCPFLTNAPFQIGRFARNVLIMQNHL